ncbi:MAG: ATP-binding cassette domain-containing protein, partial [Enterococcus sp.]|nr:ATP-binding cassette domain-containing protein [Enterococcus sp.]
MKLKIKGITKSFDGKKALDTINMTLTPGVYGLLGANGSGKTTLFRVICGVIKPDEGEITYNDQDISVNSESFRSILGFLPQDFSYYAEFSGLKFMLYIAALKGLRGKVAQRRCQELLDLLFSMKAKKEDKDSVYSVEALAQKIRLWQDRGEVVVFTNGCFDILHRGHLTYLKEAATLGDHLVVALNSD